MAGQGGGQRVKQHHQSASAGVDHPEFGEHAELFGRLLERGDGGVRGGDHSVGQIVAIGGAMFGSGRGGVQHRHDGARYLLAHRAHDEAHRVAQAGAEDHRVDVGELVPGVGRRGRRHVGQPAQYLRQDHP